MRALALLAIWPVSSALAQSRAVAVSVRVTAEGQPVAHANVRAGDRGAETNAAGLARLSLTTGSDAVIRVTLLGYAPDSLRLHASRDTLVTFALTPLASELSGIVVTSARGAQRIESEPLRVEVLAGDDVAEKTEMRPSDLTKFLAEMAGVRVQQTSAATGAASVRLQGLQPRYTLLLADGLPLYGVGGGGLDLLQLPPADLHQIEVVKGPASALYGPSALGGMINLISKRPGHEGDLLMQGTSEQGSNGFGWISRKVSDRFGYTGVAGLHSQKIRDMDGDGWADIPQVVRIEARPRGFWEWPAGHSLFLTTGATLEARRGGMITGNAVLPTGPYAETVDTRRYDVGLTAHRLAGSHGLWQLRGAGNTDYKNKWFAGQREEVTRSTGFSELSFANSLGAHDFLGGTSVEVDGARIPQAVRNEYTFTTTSVFGQDAWHFARRVSVTASARGDHHSRYGWGFSPRLSLLVDVAHGWTARLSGSQGFFAPTPFVSEADAVGVRRIDNFGVVHSERAQYASFDVHGKRGPFDLNGSLFTSRVIGQIVAQPNTITGTYYLNNATADTKTTGVETFVVYDLAPLFITGLYTYTDSREPSNATTSATEPAPLLPKHTGGIDITWEAEETGTWIALEGFYTGKQPLDRDPNLTEGKPYTLIGFLASQRLGRYKLFLNVENVADVRQSKYGPVVLPSRRATGEATTDIWAPLEGRVISLGVRISSGDLARP